MLSSRVCTRLTFCLCVHACSRIICMAQIILLKHLGMGQAAYLLRYLSERCNSLENKSSKGSS